MWSQWILTDWTRLRNHHPIQGTAHDQPPRSPTEPFHLLLYPLPRVLLILISDTTDSFRINGTMWYVLFCVWFIWMNVISSKFISTFVHLSHVHLPCSVLVPCRTRHMDFYILPSIGTSFFVFVFFPVWDYWNAFFGHTHSFLLGLHLGKFIFQGGPSKLHSHTEHLSPSSSPSQQDL